MARRGPGRPPKTADQRKSRFVRTRVQDIDVALFTLAAETENRTLSDWMRETLAAEAFEVFVRHGMDDADIDDMIWAKLREIQSEQETPE